MDAFYTWISPVLVCQTVPDKEKVYLTTKQSKIFVLTINSVVKFYIRARMDEMEKILLPCLFFEELSMKQLQKVNDSDLLE